MSDLEPIAQAVQLMDDLAAQEKTLAGKVSDNREFLRLAVKNGLLTEEQAAKVALVYPVRPKTVLTPAQRVERAKKEVADLEKAAEKAAKAEAAKRG